MNTKPKLSVLPGNPIDGMLESAQKKSTIQNKPQLSEEIRKEFFEKFTQWVGTPGVQWRTFTKTGHPQYVKEVIDWFEQKLATALEEQRLGYVKHIKAKQKPKFTDVTPDSPEIFMDFGYNNAIDDILSILNGKETKL